MSSMRAWEEVKNRVREVADIVQVISEHVQLKKAGNAFTGLCPFHGEKTSSFSVNPQGQFFHCFGCQESGDVFSFMMKYHHLTFPEALKDLAQRYQVDLPQRNLSHVERERMQQRELLYQVNQQAAQIFHKTLVSSPKAQAARQYLHKRGVPQEAVEKYQLGYTPSPEKGGWQFLISHLQKKKFSIDVIEQAGLAVQKTQGRYYDRFRDRVLFPIYDMSGREVAFGGRILGQGKPKYMNSPESMVFSKRDLLFGLYQHRQAIRSSRRAIVVEGNFDLLLLAIHGIENVVAPLGTALTREHITALRRYCDEVVLLFDGDSAGLRAAQRSIPFFLSEQLDVRVALLPTGHDPDTLIREQGAAAVQALIETADPLAEFVFSVLQEEHGLTLSGKNRIVAELAELVKQATCADQQELMAAHFAEQLGISPQRFIPEKQRTKPVQVFGPPVSSCTAQYAPSHLSDPQSTPGFPTPSDEEWRWEIALGESKENISLQELPKKQQQLLKFLLFYPEVLSDLPQGVIRESLGESPALGIVEAMEQLAVAGNVTPEKLLSVVTLDSDRQYIVELLSRDAGDLLTLTEESALEGDEGHKLCEELLLWLKREKRKKQGADLQTKITSAQNQKEYELLDTLTRELLDIRRGTGT